MSGLARPGERAPGWVLPALAAVGGTAWWLTALVGDAVTSETVWLVVGVGIGVFLLSQAVRQAPPASEVARRDLGLLLLAVLVAPALSALAGLLDAGRILPGVLAVVAGAMLHRRAGPMGWSGWRTAGAVVGVVGLVALALGALSSAAASLLVSAGATGVTLWVLSTTLVARGDDADTEGSGP